jgi:hypothetical protein
MATLDGGSPSSPGEGDPLRALLGWIGENPAAAIAILTALGFAMGGVIIASFAAGLGVAPVDLGLDVRATVTLAAGTLILPILIVVLFFLLLSLGPAARVSPYAGAVAAFGCWWIFGSIRWAAIIGAGAFLWNLVGGLVLGPGRGPREAEPQTLRRRWAFGQYRVYLALALGAFLELFILILLSVASWMSGAGIRDDRGSYPTPKILQFVLPVTRGTVTVEGNAVCVDRVGAQVVVGRSSSAAVVPEWNGFVIEDCPRGNVSELFD